MGLPELDDSAPFRLALPEFKWSADSAYFAFVFIHDEHVTTRQGIEGLSIKIRIVKAVAAPERQPKVYQGNFSADPLEDVSLGRPV